MNPQSRIVKPCGYNDFLEIEVFQLTDDFYAISKEQAARLADSSVACLERFLASEIGIDLTASGEEYCRQLPEIPENLVAVYVAVHFWLEQASLGKQIAASLVGAWVINSLEEESKKAFLS